MKTIWRARMRASLPAASLVVSLAAQPALAQTDSGAQEAPAQYTWSAMLVELDPNAETATVRSRIVSHAEIADLSAFSEGDRVTLTWSGFNWASGIRGLEPGADGPFGRFTLPVEFVSTELDGQYVNFKVPVPSGSLAEIESLPSGAWVTATSPHEPAGWDEAVADIRPYNDVAS